MKVNALAASAADQPLEAFSFELGELGPEDIDVEVKHVGLCHSDLSMKKNEWGFTAYPFVPGHEVSGVVKATGSAVQHVAPGDVVGVGWFSGFCMHCARCLNGDHNMCTTAEQTIIGRHGGFADMVRARGASVTKLPEGLDPKSAGPLLCGGITVFNPLVQFDVSPTASVGVIGIGGLGHLALKFARAWGCHVTALTSDGKREEAREMGAHDTINSRDSAAIEKAAGRFDVVLSTVNVPMDWNAIVGTLKPRGRLHHLGAVPTPLDVQVFPLLFKQASISSSPAGSPGTIDKMLEFCVRHDIQPVTEHFSFDQANEAMQHLDEGKARYRVVLDR